MTTSPLQRLGDTFEHFDERSSTLRPLRVSIDYTALVPDATAAFTLEDLHSHTELRSELEARKISEDIIRSIRQLIARDTYVPKTVFTFNGQIRVVVQYDDLGESAILPFAVPAVQPIPENTAWSFAG